VIMSHNRILTRLGLMLAVLVSAVIVQGSAGATPIPPGKTTPDPAGPLPSPNDWPQLQHDAAHIGWSQETINPPFTSTPSLWRWLDGYGRVTGSLDPVPTGPHRHLGMAHHFMDDRVAFEIGPGVLYPEAIADIRALLASGYLPQAKTKAGMDALMILHTQAKRVPAEAWDMALSAEPPLPERGEIRAMALELARLWFTEKLHQAVDYKPMALRILKDERYKM
jgi:hypothetical protein